MSQRALAAVVEQRNLGITAAERIAADVEGVRRHED